MSRVIDILNIESRFFSKQNRNPVYKVPLCTLSCNVKTDYREKAMSKISRQFQNRVGDTIEEMSDSLIPRGDNVCLCLQDYDDIMGSR